MSASPLGDFLRARRSQLAPAQIGLPAGTGLRRTPGLRREELAAASGVSIDYYTRLEQGRETNPSAAILDALAGTLRLSEEERTHLFALADHAANRARHHPAASSVVRPSILQMIETLRPSPAYVLTRTSDMLAANPEAVALHAGMSDWPREKWNTARYLFVHPMARVLFGDDWYQHAEGTVANLRAIAQAALDSPELSRLVAELTDGCGEFAALWARHDVKRRVTAVKHYHHPLVGDVTFSFESLDLGGGQRLAVLQAPAGSADYDALMLLSRTADRTDEAKIF